MNRVLLIVFLLLAGVAIWFFVGRGKSGGAYGSKDAFTIKNTDDIHKIFIGDKAGNTATLTRENGKWLYNGKFKVRKSAIKNLLETVEKMEILMLPAEAAEPTIIKDIAKNGMLARFYDKDGKKIMGYQVGASSPDGQGTNILMEGSTKPYIVHIPVWEGHLRPRYLVLEKDWRDRAVFAAEEDVISGVTIEYPNQRTHSFKLEAKNGKFEVNPYFPTTARINKEVKQGTVQNFLIRFRRLEAEAIKNGMNQELEITQQLPFAVVTLDKKNGTSKTVKFYTIPETFTSSGSVTPNNPMEVEKYFATLNDDFLLVQQVVFGKIFWRYDSFFSIGEK